MFFSGGHFQARRESEGYHPEMWQGWLRRKRFLDDPPRDVLCQRLGVLMEPERNLLIDKHNRLSQPV
jgi:hypothetical protein